MSEEDRRRDTRWPTEQDGQIGRDRNFSPCVIENISPSGALVQTRAQLALGDRVELRLPDFGAIPADVSHLEGQAAGLCFSYDATERDRMSTWLTALINS